MKADMPFYPDDGDNEGGMLDEEFDPDEGDDHGGAREPGWYFSSISNSSGITVVSCCIFYIMTTQLDNDAHIY